MAKKRGKKSGNVSMEFYGTAEVLQRIERMGKNVEDAVIKAMKEGADKPHKDMEAFAQEHFDTGDMLRSLSVQEPVVKNGKITMKVGFSVKEGGLPALFWNYGVPSKNIPPTFFIDKAVEDNIEEIKRLQLKALDEILRS